MEQLPGVFDKLSGEVGVLASAALIGLGVLYWRALSRIDSLVDRQFETSAMVADAINKIATQIELAKMRGGKDD